MLMFLHILKPVFGLVFQIKPTLLFFAQLQLQSPFQCFFVGKLSDVIKSVIKIIRPYFSKILIRSGINPSTASYLHFHFINRRTNNFPKASKELCSGFSTNFTLYHTLDFLSPRKRMLFLVKNLLIQPLKSQKVCYPISNLN